MDLFARMGQSVERLAAPFTSGGWLNVLRTCVEIVIILYAALWVWGRIRGTHAERLVKGLVVLGAVYLFSHLAGLNLIAWLLDRLIPIAVLALIIIFQPEIRRGLGYLGQSKTFRVDLSLTDNQREKMLAVIDHIIAAVRELSRTKVGALIVVEPLEGEREYLSPGTPVNAEVSSNLILSIFYPNSPLHDGAVVIRKDRIVAAGVILPMTDNPKLSYRYGTRHRAAIGLSEIYEGICIVVSEETGAISAANRGMLVRYSSADELAAPLEYIYTQSAEGKPLGGLKSFLTLFGRGKKGGGDTAGGVGSEPSATAPASAAIDKRGPARGKEGAVEESFAPDDNDPGDGTTPVVRDIGPVEPEPEHQ